MKIERLIEETGMKVLDTFDYYNRTFYTSDYKNGENIISRYMFLELTSDEFNSDFLIEKDKYHAFESAILNPFFYNANGDLGWNLYFVCVINDYHNLDKSEVVAFEKNDKYVRKLVVDKDSFVNLIPIGKVITGNDEVLNIDPSNHWFESLSEMGLEFCLDDYHSKKIDAFIEGETVKPINNELDLKNNQGVEPTNLQIKKVLMNKQYRKHCYGIDSDIEFGKVNLLSGANGSGKTSLLEAIELIMTGEIRKKNKSEKNHALVQQDVNSNITMLMNDGTTMRIPNTPAKRKVQESKLYQNRRDKRGKDKLNNVFHRYNYFTFEEVFAFCYLNDQPDYKQEFSKVIFGEDIQILERNFKKYRDEFLNRKKTFEKENARYIASINAINAIDDNDESTSFDIKNILNLLEQVNYRNSNISSVTEEVTDEQVLISWMNDVDLDLRNIQVSLQSLIQDNDKYDSINALNDSISELNKESTLKDKLYHSAVGSKKELNDQLDKKRNDRINKIKSKEETGRKLDLIRKQLKEFEEIVLPLRDVKKCNRIIQLSSDITTKNNEVSTLNKFYSLWGKFADKEFLVPNEMQKLIEQEKNTNAQLIKTKESLDKLNIEIKVEERVNGEVESLISEVKSLGEKYIELSIENKTCPLCGNIFESAIEFKAAVENMGDNNSDKLMQMYVAKKNLQTVLNDVNNNQISISRQLKDIYEINKAIEFIRKEIPDKIKRVPILIKEKIDVIKDVVNYTLEQTGLLATMKNELNMLEIGVYNLESITNALMVYNKYQDTITDKVDKEAVELIHTNLLTANRTWSEQYNQLDQDVKDYDLKITELIEILGVKSKVVEDAKNNLDTLSNNLKKLQKIFREVQMLMESSISLGENDSFIIMSNKLTSIIEIITESKTGLVNLQKKNHRQDQIGKANQKIELNIKRISKCDLSISIISKLRLASDYADDFIKDNIDDISDLFGNLHFPKEFDSLGLNEDSEIVGYRTNGNQNESVPIYLMSTGQRTAVVLSIFFKFFNSMKSIPQFILLDEPVSNIDDLNILALLDFLRELVVSKGCQVFFTTANGQVSKLFRRKFSFLRDDFYSYRFERNGNTKTRMYRDHYSEFADDSIRIEEILQ